MTRLLAVLGLLHLGVATNFSAVDFWNPDPRLACTGRVLDDARDVVVAHPTLPCGARVWIYDFLTRRSSFARVADRGPRHAMVDVAPALARRLRARGMDPVLLVGPLDNVPGNAYVSRSRR